MLISETADAGPGRARADRGPAAHGQAARPVRRPDRRAPAPVRGRRPRRPLGPRGPPGLQDRRHLRGRVRRPDAVPLQLLRRRDRGRPADPAGGADPGQRAEPDRPGDRVRLLLRARGHGAVGRRLRDRDGQLQPGDGLHRLRHRRPAVLRAADHRGRARGRARRAAGRPGGRGDRPARRADPAAAGPGPQGRRGARSSAPARRPSTWPRTAGRSRRCWPRRACRRPSTAWPAPSPRPG